MGRKEGKNGEGGWGVLVINIIKRYINLSMTSWAQESNTPRRISQRRRLKMLRNLDQYKISNPYRCLRTQPPLPNELSRQLKKIDYLSCSSIRLLSFPPPAHDSSHSQAALFKMTLALRHQQDRFRDLFGEDLPDSGPFLLDQAELELEHSCHSQQAQPTHPSQGLEAVQTKDEMPLLIYDYERSQLQESLFEQSGVRVGRQEGVVGYGAGVEWVAQGEKGGEGMGQDFQKYFSS